MKKFLAVLLSLVNLMSFASCITIQMPSSDSSEKEQVQTPPQESSNNPDDEGKKERVEVNARRYVATPVAEIKDNKYPLQASFKDDQNYYYMYYLGKIERVPLENGLEVETYEYKGDDYTYRRFTSETTEETINTCLVTANEQCRTWSQTIEIENTLNTSFLMFKDTLKTGYVNTWGGSSKTSWEKTVETTNHYSKTQSQEFSISFDESYRHGFYRFILMGDIDVFATLVYDTQTEEYYYGEINSITSSYYTLDYSETSDFKKTSDVDFNFQPSLDELEEPKDDFGVKIYLDADGGECVAEISTAEDMTVQLPTPVKEGYKFLGWTNSLNQTFADSITVGKNDIQLKAVWERLTVTGDNFDVLTIDDAGHFGLRQFAYDTINLSSLSAFFNKNHTFVFKFTVEISEKHDGSQQFYLYNGYKHIYNNFEESETLKKYYKEKGIPFAWVNKSELYEPNKTILREEAVGIGLVGEYEMGHTKGEANGTPTKYSFEMKVSGEQCKELMYLRYDAEGKDKDTWYRNSLAYEVIVEDNQ